jgi:hypothetical protein
MMTKITVFYPLEKQPEPLAGAEDLLLCWAGDTFTLDWFAEHLTDNGHDSPLGSIWENLSEKTTTPDTFEIVTRFGTIKYSITDYKVVCQDGVWGWLVEAEDTAEPCQHKTSHMLERKGTAYLELCSWGCDRAWIVSRGEKITLEEAGCPRDYWPEHCVGRTDAVIEWFLQDYKEVQPWA